MTRRRLVGALVLALPVAVLTAGCGDGATSASLAPWADGRSSMTGGSPQDPPRLPDTPEPTQLALMTDPRAGLALPSVWRVRLDGVVLDDTGSHPVDQVAWLLVTQPYDQMPSSDNDLNLLDLGLRTDTSPLDGFAGPLWLGTSTNVATDLGLPTSGPGPGDLVTVSREGDTVTAEFIEGLVPVDGIGVFAVPGGTSLVVTGSVSVTFSADGETISGAVDVSGASAVGDQPATTELHAGFEGVRAETGS